MVSRRQLLVILTRETPHIKIDCKVERLMLRSMTLEQKRHGF